MVEDDFHIPRSSAVARHVGVGGWKGIVLQCWPVLHTQRALIPLVAGMSSGISITDLHRSPIPSGIRGTAFDTDDATCAGRFE